MKTTPKKIIALAICSLMLMGSFGEISEAHHRDDAPPPPPRHYNDAPHHDEGHSSGDVNTAAIVGAVLGAVIAKVT
jgi:hypothetical protein